MRLLEEVAGGLVAAVRLAVMVLIAGRWLPWGKDGIGLVACKGIAKLSSLVCLWSRSETNSELFLQWSFMRNKDVRVVV